MINRIKSAVNFIANNQVHGNITPTEFNIALNNAVMSIYDGYFPELNRMLIMETKGQIFNGLADAPAKVRERIQYYLTHKDISKSLIEFGSSLTFFGNRFILPPDCRFIDSVVTSKSSIVEFVDNSEIFTMINTYKHTKPSIRHPLGFRAGSSFNVVPKEVEQVVLFYLRTPKHPNWTYIIPPGSKVELYNPSDPTFQNVDMHSSEELPLILEVLTQFGINLKDMELLQAAQAYAHQESQKNII